MGGHRQRHSTAPSCMWCHYIIAVPAVVRDWGCRRLKVWAGESGCDWGVRGHRGCLDTMPSYVWCGIIVSPLCVCRQHIVTSGWVKPCRSTHARVGWGLLQVQHRWIDNGQWHGTTALHHTVLHTWNPVAPSYLHLVGPGLLGHGG